MIDLAAHLRVPRLALPACRAVWAHFNRHALRRKRSLVADNCVFDRRRV